MPVQCSRCGTEWPKDPALEVPCPRCGAGVGRECRRPSQHRAFGGEPHSERDIPRDGSRHPVEVSGRSMPGEAVGDSANDDQSSLPMSAA